MFQFKYWLGNIQKCYLLMVIEVVKKQLIDFISLKYVVILKCHFIFLIRFKRVNVYLVVLYFMLNR